MRLRPEFELLDNCFKLLLKGKDINKEFLERTRDHIRVCEHIATPDSDIENSIIHRTTYWWRKRASLFGMDMTTKTIPNATALLLDSKSGDPPKVPFLITPEDKIILRSLGFVIKDEEDDLSPLV